MVRFKFLSHDLATILTWKQQWERLTLLTIKKSKPGQSEWHWTAFVIPAAKNTGDFENDFIHCMPIAQVFTWSADKEQEINFMRRLWVDQRIHIYIYIYIYIYMLLESWLCLLSWALSKLIEQSLNFFQWSSARYESALVISIPWKMCNMSRADLKSESVWWLIKCWSINDLHPWWRCGVEGHISPDSAVPARSQGHPTQYNLLLVEPLHSATKCFYTVRCATRQSLCIPTTTIHVGTIYNLHSPTTLLYTTIGF